MTEGRTRFEDRQILSATEQVKIVESALEVIKRKGQNTASMLDVVHASGNTPRKYYNIIFSPEFLHSLFGEDWADAAQEMVILPDPTTYLKQHLVQREGVSRRTLVGTGKGGQ